MTRQTRPIIQLLSFWRANVRSLRLASAYAALLAVAACNQEPQAPNATLKAFSEAARTCSWTVCSDGFVENDSCQTARRLEPLVRIVNPDEGYSDDFIEYLQNRTVIEKAYSEELERRLGASEMSHSVCGKRVVPLSELKK